jgi:hypothetical protein
LVGAGARAVAATTCRYPAPARHPTTPSSSRRRGSIRALTHHWIPACAGMTSGRHYSRAQGLRIKPRHITHQHDVSRHAMTAWRHHWLLAHCWLVRAQEQPRHVATLRPPHPVILAQARIPALPYASLDSCLRRNDGLLVHCWLVQAQVQIRARVPPRHVATLRLPNALPPRHPRAGEDPYAP